jgi:hypothetical protein
VLRLGWFPGLQVNVPFHASALSFDSKATFCEKARHQVLAPSTGLTTIMKGLFKTMAALFPSPYISLVGLNPSDAVRHTDQRGA